MKNFTKYNFNKSKTTVSCNASHTLNAGFNIVEVILVSMVIAILVTLFMPQAYDMFKLQKENTEQNELNEMKRALQAYASENNALPPTATAFNDLTDYTNMYSSEMLESEWDGQRYYVGFNASVPYRYTTVDISYGIFISLGLDNCLNMPDLVNVGAILNICADADIIVALNDIDSAAEFQLFQVFGDDMFVKYTNLQLVRKRYEKTAERLERIAEALDAYGKIHKYTAIRTAIEQDNDDLQNMIFYPPSGNSWPDLTAVTTLYTGDVIAEVQATTSVVSGAASDFIDNSNDAAARLDGMVALVKILGLPASFCCNALELVDHDVDANTENVENPFYYYSNPRPRGGGGGCIGLSVPAFGERYYPPRITAFEDVCGVND